MRQYFTGFFSALCLSASFYLFTEVSHDNSDNNEENQVVLTSEDGKTIIEGGSMRFINKEGKEIVYIGVDKKWQEKFKCKIDQAIKQQAWDLGMVMVLAVMVILM